MKLMLFSVVVVVIVVVVVFQGKIICLHASQMSLNEYWETMLRNEAWMLSSHSVDVLEMHITSVSSGYNRTNIS